jgi:hypothetical protein
MTPHIDEAIERYVLLASVLAMTLLIRMAQVSFG